MGNGFCNDDTNIAACNYDGGDCCSNPDVVGNGFCNDNTNTAECVYDGGDCCVNVNTDYCSDCYCLGGSFIASPGFPGNYDNNLDLTWIIRVRLVQIIDIKFLYFDIESHSSCK